MSRMTIPAVALLVAATSACGGPDDAGQDLRTKSLDLDTGQPLELDVTADEAGQLHVHSSPVHTFDYEAGRTRITFSVDRPGIVDVESHALDTLILKLRVQ
jgi:hypothetical protein